MSQLLLEIFSQLHLWAYIIHGFQSFVLLLPKLVKFFYYFYNAAIVWWIKLIKDRLTTHVVEPVSLMTLALWPLTLPTPHGVFPAQMHLNFLLFFWVTTHYFKKLCCGHGAQRNIFWTRAKQQLRWATVATIDMGRKERGCCAPFAGAGTPFSTM